MQLSAYTDIAVVLFTTAKFCGFERLSRAHALTFTHPCMRLYSSQVLQLSHIHHYTQSLEGSAA